MSPKDSIPGFTNEEVMIGITGAPEQLQEEQPVDPEIDAVL